MPDAGFKAAQDPGGCYWGYQLFTPDYRGDPGEVFHSLACGFVDAGREELEIVCLLCFGFAPGTAEMNQFGVPDRELYGLWILPPEYAGNIPALMKNGPEYLVELDGAVLIDGDRKDGLFTPRINTQSDARRLVSGKTLQISGGIGSRRFDLTGGHTEIKRVVTDLIDHGFASRHHLELVE